MTIVLRHPNAITELWPSTGELCTRVAAQERAREKALKRLAKLRKKATAEIERLIAFLDASDPYVMTELEDEADAGPCDTDELEQDLASPDPRTSGDYLGRSPWIARTFDQSRFQGEDAEADDSDDEPSLGSLERHPSLYGVVDGRNWTGDQTAWAAAGVHDLEDEHDGAEPGEDKEPSLGSFDRLTNQEHSWAGDHLMDYEQDDCDRESDDPLLTECV